MVVVVVKIVVGLTFSSAMISIEAADVELILFLLGPGRIFAGLRFCGLFVMLGEELGNEVEVEVPPD